MTETGGRTVALELRTRYSLSSNEFQETIFDEGNTTILLCSAGALKSYSVYDKNSLLLQLYNSKACPILPPKYE